MDTGQALTRFFKRDSTKANNLTLYPHKEKEFWMWISTWALVITKPSDMGYPDDGYNLPELRIHEEIVNVDHETAGYEDNGQKKIFRDAALGLQQAARERRDNMSVKVQKVVEILNRPENINDNFLLWHDLENERHELCRAVKGCRAVYGSQDDDEAETIIEDFRNGRLQYLAAKPEMLGEGQNFQYHCHKAIMFIDYRFNDKYQAFHRIYRFMQKHPVDIYLVYAESEGEIFKSFMKKWKQHNEMIDKLVSIFRENGIFGTNAEEKMMRYMFASRDEYQGKRFTSINNDNVLECKQMKDNSVGLIVTSVPFSNHYEYTPSYNDFGHNKDNDAFFEQMDYLTPELLRILQPGRVLAVHVKDRILFGNATGNGFPTLDPFHALCIMHYMKHGFYLFGIITVDTDVVRENNQTYRLGYTEMCKDGSKMGVGCPEYVLLFRKLPTDTSNAYADVPVVKEKSEYSLARWQIDAHASWKSSGNRLLTFDDIRTADIGKIRRLFRDNQRENIYNYESHVSFAEELEACNKLPKTFMAIDPVSKKEWIWDDVLRMRTLNSRQSQKNLQMHVCPLQLDIVERLIERYSNRGDLVFDPFGGIGTVPYCAVRMGRYGLSTELNYDYWRDGLRYSVEAENEILSPTLFDFIKEENKVEQKEVV
jgi:DNA modification methylase